MAQPVNRASIAKELEPGLNAIFGTEYKRYEQEHIVLFDTETSQRAFEEEVLFAGFDSAPVKSEGSSVSYDQAQEVWTARYTHETIALAFSITEEAMEDNLYDSLSKRLTRALARSMANTKEVKGATVYNNAFATAGGDGVSLLNVSHPLSGGGTFSNKPAVDVDVSETAFEDAIIQIAGWTDERGLLVAAQAMSLHIPVNQQFAVQRILASPYRVQTADNDINALYQMNSFPKGWFVNHYFTDTDAWFIRTDIPDGLKYFDRVSLKTSMEGDFDTGNMRYKARERYVFGFSNPRGLFGSSGG